MKTILTFLVIGAVTFDVSAGNLSVCVKSNGTARISGKCNPKTETKQYISSSPSPDGNGAESGVHVVTVKHTFPVGYKPVEVDYERPNWYRPSELKCPDDESAVSRTKCNTG